MKPCHFNNPLISVSCRILEKERASKTIIFIDGELKDQDDDLPRSQNLVSDSLDFFPAILTTLGYLSQ